MDPFAQAQDDLRQEQLTNLAKRVLPWVALALVLLIAGVGTSEAWQAFNNHIARKETEKLMVAANAPDSVPALLAAAEKDSGHRAAIAQLIAFQRMSPAEQKDKGLTVLDKLAADGKAPGEWRDFAALTATRARIAFGATAAEADALLTALSPIISNKESPWYAAAQVQAALIEGEMKGDKAAANARLTPLQGTSQDEVLGKEIIMLQNHYAAYAPTKETSK